jgi:hypothetical protein
MATEVARIEILENYVKEHVATKAQVEAVEKRLTKLLDSMDEQLSAMGNDIKDILNYVKP